MNTEKVNLIIEGTDDELILKHLLPETTLRNVNFVIGGRKYAALSLARSMVAVRQVPVVFVIDADTLNESAAQQTVSELQESLESVSPNIPFEVIAFMPEIEMLFFQNRRIAEQVTGHKFSKEEFARAQSRPKEALKSRLTDSLAEALTKLTDADVWMLRTEPSLKQLTAFVSTVFEKHT